MYISLGGEIMAKPKDVQDALKRANDVAKLGNPTVLPALIDALDKKDETAFKKACKTKLNLQNTGLTQGDFDDFLDDIWKDSKNSHKDTQASKPCW